MSGMQEHETVSVNGQAYLIPQWILDNNAKAEDFYKVLNFVEFHSGQDDFDRLGDNDFLDSECFSAYAVTMGINEGDALIRDVADSLFGWVTDYDAEDHTLVCLKPLKI